MAKRGTVTFSIVPDGRNSSQVETEEIPRLEDEGNQEHEQEPSEVVECPKCGHQFELAGGEGRESGEVESEEPMSGAETMAHVTRARGHARKVGMR